MPPKKAMKGKGKIVKPGPCQKGKKTMKVKKAALKAKNLQKLGKLSLAEKVAKAAEGIDSAEEAAHNLKNMLSKQEHSRVWSKYNIHLKGQPKKQQKDFEKANKNEKGILANSSTLDMEPEFIFTKVLFHLGFRKPLLLLLQGAAGFHILTAVEELWHS